MRTVVTGFRATASTVASSFYTCEVPGSIQDLALRHWNPGREQNLRGCDSAHDKGSPASPPRRLHPLVPPTPLGEPITAHLLVTEIPGSEIAGFSGSMFPLQLICFTPVSKDVLAEGGLKASWWTPGHPDGHI